LTHSRLQIRLLYTRNTHCPKFDVAFFYKHLLSCQHTKNLLSANYSENYRFTAGCRMEVPEQKLPPSYEWFAEQIAGHHPSVIKNGKREIGILKQHGSDKVLKPKQEGLRGECEVRCCLLHYLINCFLRDFTHRYVFSLSLAFIFFCFRTFILFGELLSRTVFYNGSYDKLK
ncbi:hypothetical protein OESDEN_07296, partial [Oesophagostomum dentatum]